MSNPAHHKTGSSPLARGLRGAQVPGVGGWGSSPLARGLHPRSVRPLAGRRIIPARAGFTTGTMACRRRCADHPRSRGVYTTSPLSQSAGRGSSPLARGLHSESAESRNKKRIIPARAGFTSGMITFSNRGWDHPRSRGVYTPVSSPLRWYHGSSPLARGLRPGHDPRGGAPGIIPARAGFTATGVWGHLGARDHPRSRGVYSSVRRSTASTSGSSPLARGLPHGDILTGGAGGIIPARAGFTPSSTSCCPTVRDHPRSRGVYQLELTPRARQQGSSPLARGLRKRSMVGVPFWGIIPARAGFTPCSRSR